MKRPPTRYVSAAAPVNRRTSAAVPRTVTQGLAGQRRALKVRTRLNMGVPLSERMPTSVRPTWTLPLTLAACAVALCLLLSLMLGQISGLAGLAFMVVSAAVLIGAWLAYRRQRAAAAPAAWLDAQSLQAFDHLLATALAKLDPLHAELLREIKRELVEIAQRDCSVAKNGEAAASRLAAEDRHFVLESLRRYLPDAVATYLALPDGARHRPLSGGQASAADALTDQLQQGRDRLRLCAANALRELEQAVLQQQQFMQAKQRRQ